MIKLNENRYFTKKGPLKESMQPPPRQSSSRFITSQNICRSCVGIDIESLNRLSFSKKNSELVGFLSFFWNPSHPPDALLDRSKSPQYSRGTTQKRNWINVTGSNLWCRWRFCPWSRAVLRRPPSQVPRSGSRSASAASASLSGTSGSDCPSTGSWPLSPAIQTPPPIRGCQGNWDGSWDGLNEGHLGYKWRHYVTNDAIILDSEVNCVRHICFKLNLLEKLGLLVHVPSTVSIRTK